ncbi:MAG TPA: TIGR04282 family arsenosugar biosynthesis glycosyltransferase [Acidimicrobiales bacterium]
MIIVAKEPVPGRVKTRLCPPCTPREAAALAAASLADTLTAARRSGAARVVLALDGRPGPWCPPGVEVVGQGGGGLDRRLTAAWAAATTGAAVLVGMDTPQATAADLDAAMAALADDGADAVLGPASDGGWWAIGLRRPHARAFLGVPMSRPDTGAHQRARLRALGLRTHLLPMRTDVDTWADALAVAGAAPDGGFAAVVRTLAARGPGSDRPPDAVAHPGPDDPPRVGGAVGAGAPA